MTILITGGSKGIGFAIAERFIASLEGSATKLKLAICARDTNEIEEAAKVLRATSSQVEVLAGECDVADEQAVARFAAMVEARFGAVDVLVNNAGFGIFKSVVELSAQEFDSVIAANLRGVFLMTKAVLPGMRARKTGTIVTISSLAGKNGFAGGAAYCASKFGVRGLMQSLFLEVREDDIRVITLFPGSVDTGFFSTAGTTTLRSNHALRPEDIAESVFAAVALSQHADISELDIRPTNPKKK